jgi:hypothetical protein
MVSHSIFLKRVGKPLPAMRCNWFSCGAMLFSLLQATTHAPQPVHLSMSMTMPHLIGKSWKVDILLTLFD